MILKDFYLIVFRNHRQSIYNQINKKSNFMSKYTTARITALKNHQKKHLFLKDTQSDIFLVLNNKFFPLHRNILDGCIKFKNELSPEERIYFIEEQLDCQIFQKVLASLYGYQLNFSRNIEVEKFLKVIKFFGIQTLEEAIYQDFKLNFQQYGPILLFKISRSFSLPWLQKKCLETFVSLKFQQLFIYKFDLMNCDQQTFEQIMKNHEILKSKNIVKGIQPSTIKKIIQQYSEMNSTQVDIEQVFSISAQDEQQTEQILGFKQQDYQIKRVYPKKRKSTWHCSSQNFNKNYKIKQNIDKKSLKEVKKVKCQQLKQANIQIQNRLSSTLQQIKETKKQMRKLSFQDEKQIQKLNFLVKNMQKTFDQQSKELKLLKQKTLEFSGRKSGKSSPLK